MNIDDASYKAIIKKLNRQDKQIKMLKAKTITLQEALIRSINSPRCDLEHSLASVTPVVSRFFPDTDSTVIAFGGLSSGIGMPPAEFLKTFTSKQVNTVFVKDFKQCWYQRGLLGLSDDIYATVDVIKKQLPENQKSIYTIGTSAGGYAAILFGILLGVDKILAFGPQTILTRPIFRQFKSIESNQQDVDFNGEFCNLKQLLEATDYKGSIHIHYPKNNSIDKAEAEHLMHFECVHLHPWDTDIHNIAGWLKQQKMLNNILDEAFHLSDKN